MENASPGACVPCGVFMSQERPRNLNIRCLPGRLQRGGTISLIPSPRLSSALQRSKTQVRVTLGLAFIIRMHPNVGHGLPLGREPDHVHRRGVSRRPARSAFQRGLKFPDRRVARPADVLKRNAGPRFRSDYTFDLQPAVHGFAVRWLPS